MRQKQQALTVAATAVVADIVNHACVALNAGCFAAGTKLLTEQGWRQVEDIRPGERVLSRAEGQPYGENRDNFNRIRPVKWVHVASGAEVNIDAVHYAKPNAAGWNSGPDIPHVGYTNIAGTVGHIYLDYVTRNRP